MSSIAAACFAEGLARSSRVRDALRGLGRAHWGVQMHAEGGCVWWNVAVDLGFGVRGRPRWCRVRYGVRMGSGDRMRMRVRCCQAAFMGGRKRVGARNGDNAIGVAGE